MTTPRPTGLGSAGLALVALALVAVVGLAGTSHRRPPTDHPVRATHSWPTQTRSGPLGATATSAPTNAVVQAKSVDSLSGAERQAVQVALEVPALASVSDPASVPALVAKWATPGRSDSLAAQVEAGLAKLRSAPGGPYSFWSAPLAVGGALVGGGQAHVKVLCAEVVFRRGQPEYSALVIEDSSMVRYSGQWRLDATTDPVAPSLGPAPGSVPSPPVEAAAQLSGFASVADLELDGVS